MYNKISFPKAVKLDMYICLNFWSFSTLIPQNNTSTFRRLRLPGLVKVFRVQTETKSVLQSHHGRVVSAGVGGEDKEKC